MFKTLIDYVQNTSQQDRQQHIDLSTECSFKGKGKKEYTSKRRSQDAARENIVKFLISEGILDTVTQNEKLSDSGVQCNHKCKCHSGITEGAVCNNPLHLYLGTAKENYHDIDENTGLSAKEKAVATRNSPEGFARASLAQKLSWAERKAKLLQTDKD